MKDITEEVLADPGVHTFCKDIIRRGLTLDPLDAVYDVELALRVLKEHCVGILLSSAYPPACSEG